MSVVKINYSFGPGHHALGEKCGIFEGTLENVVRSLLALDPTNQHIVVNKRVIANRQSEFVVNEEEQKPLGLPSWESDTEEDDTNPPGHTILNEDGQAPLGLPTWEPETEESKLVANDDGQISLGLPSWD
jgi:hypothetical protein